LRASAFVGTGVSGPREGIEAGGENASDQPVEPLISAAAALQPCEPFARLGEQELLRHANSRITLHLHAQAGMPKKRLAQSKLVQPVMQKGKALA